MEAIFIELMKQLNSSVFVLIAVLLVIFVLLFKAGRMTEYFKSLKEKDIKYDDTIDKIKESLAKIQATTDLLYQSHLSTVQSRSPLNLTVKGEKVARDLSLDQKINEYWEKIYNIIQKKDDLDNPYDIQVVSMDTAKYCFENILSEKEQKEIKLYAFKIGMNLLEIYPIVGILIRNKLLTLKGFSLENIKKHEI